MKQTIYSYGLNIAEDVRHSIVIAEATQTTDGVKIELIKNHAFKMNRFMVDSFKYRTDEEKVLLQEINKIGNLYLNAPLDLQGMPLDKLPKNEWELSSRAIDRVYQRLVTTGKLIAPVEQRLRLMLKPYKEKLPFGAFETDPALILEESGYKSMKHKGCSIFVRGSWSPNNSLSAVLNDLNWSAENGERFSYADLGASLCALTGISSSHVDVQGKLDAYFPGHQGYYKAPKAYEIINNIPKNVILSWRNGFYKAGSMKMTDKTKRRINDNYIEETSDKELFKIGLVAMVKNLDYFLEKKESFDELLVLGSCGILRAMKEYSAEKSDSIFIYKACKYSKLYISRSFKNSDYLPDEIKEARKIQIDNTRIKTMLRIYDSLRLFTLGKIVMLKRKGLQSYHVNKAVYSALLDTVDFYASDTCCKYFTSPEAYMTSKIQGHLGLKNKPSKEVVSLLKNLKIK